MAKIKLIKLSEAENPKHPNNIPEGHIVEGDFMRFPELGERFYVGFAWSTSAVQEIISYDTFRTFNSIYKVEPVNE